MNSPRIKAFTAVAAALGWTALALQFWLSMRRASGQGMSVAGGIITYFSFFTVLTNILAALALTAALVRSRSGVLGFFARPDVNTGMAASIAVVGIAYHLLLRHTWNPEGLQLVADVALHYVMPVVFLIYWWVAVAGERSRWKNIGWWALYPIGYLIFALGRGALSGIYPYPFIDAGTLGYPRALSNAAGILVGFVAVALGLIAVGRLKGRARAAASVLGRPSG